MPEQYSPDIPLFSEDPAVRRAEEIATERQQIVAEKMAGLLENPRVATLLETGQVTVASALAAEQAAATTELPRVTFPERKRTRVNTRGGRSFNEGSDSEHDPYLHAPGPQLTPEQETSGRQKLKEIAEQMRLDNAAKSYQSDLAQELADPDGKPNHAVARLMAKGFRPDPNTGGKTVVRIKTD